VARPNLWGRKTYQLFPPAVTEPLEFSILRLGIRFALCSPRRVCRGEIRNSSPEWSVVSTKCRTHSSVSLVSAMYCGRTRLVGVLSNAQAEANRSRLTRWQR